MFTNLTETEAPPLLTCPLFIHDPPEGLGSRFDLLDDLKVKLVEIREREAKLQSLLRRADDDPYAISDEFRQSRLALAKSEADFHSGCEVLYRSYSHSCEAKFRAAEKTRDDIGAAIFGELQTIGYAAGEVDARFFHKRYGSLTTMVESNPRWQSAEQDRQAWHDQRLGWGESAVQERTFAGRCDRARDKMVQAARESMGV